MRAPIRRTLAALRAADLEVTKVVEGRRHVEVHLASGTIIRIHRGSRESSHRVEPALRSAIRKLTRTGTAP